MSNIIKTLCVSVLVIAALCPMKTTTAQTSNAKADVQAKDKLDLYIERLAFAESGGKENIDIIDVNGKHSRGCLQYQDATIKSYARKYNLLGNPLDCRYQKALTRQVLLHGGWRNWLYSVQKLGGPGKIPVLHLQEASTNPILGRGHGVLGG